ncbi:hypothetical protein Q3G72_006509 [Acer saccharum]|nr:hypothetical protein Q3G72_006509 [Acer saccharum]
MESPLVVAVSSGFTGLFWRTRRVNQLPHHLYVFIFLTGLQVLVKTQKHISAPCRSNKRERPKGLKNKIRPEIRMLVEATVHYAYARFKELKVISILTETIMPDTYHTLGLVYDTIGNAEKAAGFYELAAENNPRDLTLWKQLCA